MSELKYYPACITTPKGKFLFPNVYLKDEADKVLAEKDAEIAQLQAMLEERNKQVGELKAQKAQAEDDCAYWKSKAQRERHHKYKRCKEMAMWCETELEKLDYKEAINYTNKDVWRIATSYFTIWHKRWLELAEKFKEANNG